MAYNRFIIAILALLINVLLWVLHPLKTPLDEFFAGLYPLTMILFGGLVVATKPADQPTQNRIS